MKKISKVGKSILKDMLKFKNMGETRDEIINNSSDADILYKDPISEKALHLHPLSLNVIVKEIIPRYDAKEYVLSSLDSSPLPYFKAGSYISIKTRIGDSFTSRPYSICSSPKKALNGSYSVMIEDYRDGFVAPYLYKNLKVGD